MSSAALLRKLGQESKIGEWASELSHLFRLAVGSASIAQRSSPLCASGQTVALVSTLFTGVALQVCVLSSSTCYGLPFNFPSLMYRTGMFGYSHFTGGFAGGQAEFVRVPYGDVNLLPLPDDVPDEVGLYLSDVLCTSWNAVVDTGVQAGDTVAVWGGGPVGQMAVEFAVANGAKRVILIDGGQGHWRLDFVKSKVPQLETINYTALPKGETVVSTLKKMCDGRGPDIAIECAAGEYSKTLGHTLQRAAGLENDTPELVNEMIESVRGFGSCGVTGIYTGYVCKYHIVPFHKCCSR